MAKAHRAIKVPRSAQLPLILRAAVFGGAYLAAADLSTLLQIEPGPFRCVWLPAGLYLAVLVLSPRKEWPAFILASLVAGLTFDRLQGHRTRMSTPWPVCIRKTGPRFAPMPPGRHHHRTVPE